ncbi:hypothetical protein Oscil6304_3600 [Oscillatoria acuminata PCC 6304]|uniref:Uncharacterized protein n=1 Tax=Oscillatoria acuminata PCC 6304 TaxID=56110 RepID=K9TL74_9CYAN|nr:hypothetical protein Oscil6304_3600 [Oscillatoria acuminata PCC 6304]
MSDQWSTPVNVGAQCAGPPEGLRIAPLHRPSLQLNVWRIYILQSPYTESGCHRSAKTRSVQGLHRRSPPARAEEKTDF